MDTVAKTQELIGEQKKLTRVQKQAVGLLSIGTFLEFFDLMLFVHMAVLLNDLFFPKTDPYATSLLTAFAYCSAFVFRPIGALIFGWIGDNIGRKATVTITTMMMAVIFLFSNVLLMHVSYMLYHVLLCMLLLHLGSCIYQNIMVTGVYW